MKIANLTELQIREQLIIMIKWMGYKNDYPDKPYSWWYIGNDVHNITDMVSIEQLMDNDIAMEHFLLEVVERIGGITLHFSASEWNVSFNDKSVLHTAKTLNEALFLSISDYTNKK